MKSIKDFHLNREVDMGEIEFEGRRDHGSLLPGLVRRGKSGARAFSERLSNRSENHHGDSVVQVLDIQRDLWGNVRLTWCPNGMKDWKREVSIAADCIDEKTFLSRIKAKWLELITLIVCVICAWAGLKAIHIL